MVEGILDTARDLLYYLMTGDNKQEDSSLPNAVAHISHDQFFAYGQTRSVHLQQEKVPPVPFPAMLKSMPEIEKAIYEHLDPGRMAAFTVKKRISRYISAFIIRSLLLVPQPVTRKEIFQFVDSEKSVESFNANSLLERRI
jgi:hypothetical protein